MNNDNKKPSNQPPTYPLVLLVVFLFFAAMLAMSDLAENLRGIFHH